jgi:hypothetical protein
MVAKSCRNCGTVCQGSICADCKPAETRRRDQRRGTPSQRGYDAEYRRNRLVVVDQAKRGKPCCICGLGFNEDELVTAEHVIPLRHGGSNDKSNLSPAHSGCNSAWNKKQ